MSKHTRTRSILEPGTAVTRRILVIALVLLVALSLPVLAGRPAEASEGPRSFLETSRAVQGDGVHRLGLRLAPDADYPRAELAPKLKAGVDLPTAVDLSSQLPPIGDQGNQGSCIGWSSTYYYKTWSEKQEHTTWNLTNSKYDFSPSWTYNQINGGRDQGATFPDAFTLLQNKGATDIAEFPYSDSNYTRQPTSAQFEAAKPYKIASGWSAFWNRSDYGPFGNPNSITNAKAWLDQGKMLVMAIPIYNDWPDYGGNPSRSYYDYNGYSSLGGGHGVCIVGYDDSANPGGSDADHRGGFKMVNSWGPSWNGNGYVYLSYDFVKRYVWEAWTMTNLTGDNPSISSLSPTSGNSGTSVTINGNNFGTLRRSARVTFNGTAATSVSFTNSRVTATVPSGATTGPVVVYDWDGAASNGATFTVGGSPPPSGPTVTGVSPNTGENTGAVSASISGSGFVSGCGVKLARSGSPDINGTGVGFVSSSRVDCTLNLNGSTAGAWDVVVTNPDATSGTLTGGFTITQPGGGDYEPNDSIEQAYGPLSPGVVYSSFISASYDEDYYSGNVPSGSDGLTIRLESIPPRCDYDLYLYNSAGRMISYSDNADNSPEQIDVPNPGQGIFYMHVHPYSGYSTTDSYLLSYSVGGGGPADAPRIGGLSPSSGTKGCRITISGSGFGASRGGSFVKFGSVKCASSDYASWSDTRLTVLVPGGVGGKLYVTVTTGNGTSNEAVFKVVPLVTALNPARGRAGAWVTVSGNGFGAWSSGTTCVYFGGVKAYRYYSWSSSSIRVQVPGGVRGTVSVKVKTAGGTSAGKSFVVL